VAGGDIDADGDVDVIVGTSTSDDVVLLRNVGGTFALAESSGLASFAGFAAPGVKAVVVRDFDGDGRMDVAAARGDFNSGSVAVLDNNQAGGSYRLTLNGSIIVNNQNFGVAVAAPPQAGDYNRSGAVQQADYSMWSASFGVTSGPALNADGNGNLIVDAADYVVWRKFLPVGSGGGAEAAAAPAAGAGEYAALVEGGAVLVSSSARDEKTVVAIDKAFSGFIAESWIVPRIIQKVNTVPPWKYSISRLGQADLLIDLPLAILDREPLTPDNGTEIMTDHSVDELATELEFTLTDALDCDWFSLG